MNTLAQLVCPKCRQPLTESVAGVSCGACGCEYPKREGIISFLESVEQFNPGAYKGNQEAHWTRTAQLRERIRQNRWLSLANRLRILLSMSGRRDRVFYREMSGGPHDRLILDVGCGGGRHYFCDYGRVVGIDPVVELLNIAKTMYAEVYHASAMEMPFADESFDYVVSSDVIGHIQEKDKDNLFAEMHRVLKQGGRTVHVIETDSINPWFRFGHRHPELFQEYFVDRPGHIGLELPSQLRARFLKHGFKEIAFKRIGGVIQECGMPTGFFNNEFANRHWLMTALVAGDRLLSRNLLVKEAVNLLLEPLAQIDDRLSPFDYSSGALVVFEK